MAKTTEDRAVRSGTKDGRVRRLHAFVRTHRVAAATLTALGLAAAIFFVAWFQPQKLIIETRVNEAAPAVTSEDAGAETKVLAQGSFRTLEHGTTGTAKIIRLADGARVLRFEELDTSNGPDLRVFLSPVEAVDDARAYGERFVDLGALKGNKGNQNYEIPDGVDLDDYGSAVIWCRRFSVGFGVAPLGA